MPLDGVAVRSNLTKVSILWAMSEYFFASRIQHNPCLVKMKTLGKAALINHWPSNLLSRSILMSLMEPVSRSHCKQLRVSKPSPQLNNPHWRLVLWHGSGSPLPLLKFHQRWMSALVGLKEMMLATVTLIWVFTVY